jgi:hypothetical protein
MSKGRHIRAFAYVNHPYDKVQAALHQHADEIFRSATRAASSRAHEVASGLHITIGGVEVGTEVVITVKSIEDDPNGPLGAPATRLHLEWEAARSPRFFPLMKGELSAYALSGTETQLDFEGHYEPPMGVVGSAMDAVMGHRIAEASVHRFVSDIAAHLRRTGAE